MEFTEWLQNELNERGWNQADLAKTIGSPNATISRIMSGSRNIGPELCM